MDSGQQKIDKMVWETMVAEMRTNIEADLRQKMADAKKINDIYTPQGGTDDVQLVTHECIMLCAYNATEASMNRPFYMFNDEIGRPVGLVINYKDYARAFVPGAPLIAERIDVLPGEIGPFVSIRFVGYDINMVLASVSIPVTIALWEVIRKKELQTSTELIQGMTGLVAVGGIPLTKRLVEVMTSGAVLE